jgi:hypothetical protein
MPTAKQRITLTATGELERILAVESRLHPEMSASELVAMLVARGHAAGATVAERDQLVRRLAGGVRYPAGYLDELRNEWPE